MRLTLFVKDSCQEGKQCSELHLVKSKYLSEFLTEVEKAKARENLGITELNSANSLKGGYHIVLTIPNLILISEDLLIDGTLGYVIKDSSGNHFYMYLNKQWLPILINSGNSSNNSIAEYIQDSIPIYNSSIINNAGYSLPEKYIIIRDADDLNGEITSNTYTTSKNGNYVDILFQAIRALLSEVARLKNSFKYGINSYTDEDTALSSMSKSIEDVDNEPLWAIEEEDLSLVDDVAMDSKNGLTPTNNVDTTIDGLLTINGTANYNCKFSEITDSKLFVYITSCSKNILINLSDGDLINLNSLVHNSSKYYNYIIIVSREIINEDETNGYNYIYIQVSNNNKILTEGYYQFRNTLYTNPVYLDKVYNIESIDFTNTTLTKLTTYSRYLDFSNYVIPSIPSEEDYKYKAAHLTIRSVKNKTVLEKISNLLLNNELVWIESLNSLYIKSNNNLIAVGSAKGDTNTTSGMTEEEVIELLQELGIVQNNDDSLSISNIADITFIHQATGNKYKITIDADGNLISLKISEDGKLENDSYVNNALNLSGNIRGFFGTVNALKQTNNANTVNNLTSDIGLKADRVKIGAVYAPLDTDTVFGCSHAYIELENTSDIDYNLDGVYLHYAKKLVNGNIELKHLALTGIIKAGSTYLIRGKKYTDKSQANCVISVDSYDQEWYDENNLIDFTFGQSRGIAFAITYGLSNLQFTDKMFEASGTSCQNYNVRFIDGIALGISALDGSNSNWARQPFTATSNTIYKNVFELDPAKQAFQALYSKDSSRVRWQNTSDFLNLKLNTDKIEFYHSDDTMDISKYTPKASFENKNVCTDKTKLDLDKPNMVTCSFGLNIDTTRCFNWISAGLYDEYVFIKQDDGTWKKFESYKTISTANQQSSTYPCRKEYSTLVNNTVYARINSTFPADGTNFTAHKCVIIVIDLDGITDKKTYTYVVGRSDKYGNPDPEHTSEEYTFTIYPETYTPIIFQITDLQGFHWTEYQVWAAAANKINDEISKLNNVVPILVNTGDMTQNGTRINEWLDYYNAGKCLFNHLELMNVVGNNDLCGTIPTELGTGDDNGKSNSYYFHLFYCYDIDTDYIPIIKGNDNVYRYIPSLYSFGNQNVQLVMVNSEITQINCKDWFKLTNNDDTINIYTGFTINSNNYISSSDNKYIYELLYGMLNKIKDQKIIVACHEMPFTVITSANLASNTINNYRSYDASSNAMGLVGSHLNQITENEQGKGIYWFSRLLEYFGVKLCIGGHKHTYACTYPLRENYVGMDVKTPMTMNPTLENDNITWINDGQNLTKFPITNVEFDLGTPLNGYFFPLKIVSEMEGGVVYFMCQATGYKLNSNKELPAPDQRFSLFLPQTSNSKPDSNQLYPMYGRIQIGAKFNILLIRIVNIKGGTDHNTFNQSTYSTDDMKLQYLTSGTQYYGSWTDDVTNLVQV